MTQFLIKDTLIPPYMAFPRFLLDMEQLSETAKIRFPDLFFFCAPARLRVRHRLL